MADLPTGAVPSGQPFSFWYGAREPHRAYEYGSGVRAGTRLEQIDEVYAAWPDNERVRNDLLDYALEIEHFDRNLARVIATLEAAGELDNTLIIVTSDHGNPLPRSKCNLYDGGTRVPFAVRWPGKIPAGTVCNTPAMTIDILPTVAHLIGATLPATSWIPASGPLPIESERGTSASALLIALENLFPPIPSEVVLPLAGFVASGGDASLVGMIVAATIGSMVGAFLLYGIAAAIGPIRLRALVVRHGRWFGLDETDLISIVFTATGR